MSKLRALLLISVFVIVAFSIVRLAVPVAYGSGGTLIIKGDGCWGPDMSFSGPLPITGRATTVWTNNEQGIVNVSCTGRLPAGAVLPDKAARFTPENSPAGLGCMAPRSLDPLILVPTTDWFYQITPSGRVQLICKIH